MILFKKLSVFSEILFIKRYGSMFEGFKIKKSALIYNILLLMRRLIFAFSCTYLHAYQSLQFQIYTLCSFFNLIYLLHVKPFEDPFINRLEIFNECMLMIGAYHILVFFFYHRLIIRGSYSSWFFLDWCMLYPDICKYKHFDR